VGAKRGEEMPFDGMKGLGEDAKGAMRWWWRRRRGGQRGRGPRPRGAEEEGSRRAAEGRSIGLGGRDEAEAVAMVKSEIK